MRHLAPTLILVLFAFSCHDKPTEPPPGSPTLAVEDVSCTEAWLRIQFADRKAYPLILRRDGQTILSSTVSAIDTVILDQGLLAGHTYSYDLSVTGFSGLHSTVQATTLNVTSGNFTWHMDTLGAGNSSILYDVAIINDTLVYAVGEMYLKDSLGNWDNNAYNVVRWNGNRWELMRIPFLGSCSAVLYPAIRAIWAFSANNILLTNGGSIVNYDGVAATMDCRINSLLAGEINRIYATSPQDEYVVGNVGTIIHYNGAAWQKLSTGTTQDVQDIWGGMNPRTGQLELLAVASHWAVSNDRVILQINGTNVSTLSDQGITQPLNAVWFSPQRRYYVAGGGFYQKIFLSDTSWMLDPSASPTYYINAIRGTDVNDVIAVGGFGEVVHFNGVSWQSYHATTGLTDGNYMSVAIKGDLVVAVGWQYPRAVVAIGRR